MIDYYHMNSFLIHDERDNDLDTRTSIERICSMLSLDLHLFKHCRRPSQLTRLYGRHLRVWTSNRVGWGHV